MWLLVCREHGVWWGERRVLFGQLYMPMHWVSYQPSNWSGPITTIHGPLPIKTPNEYNDPLILKQPPNKQVTFCDPKSQQTCGLHWEFCCTSFTPTSLVHISPSDLAKDPDLIEAMVWNLRTWPLELVEWNTTNSHRLDITFNPEQDRYQRENPLIRQTKWRVLPNGMLITGYLTN